MCNLKLNCFIDVFVQLGRVHQALNTIFIYYHLITFLWRMCQQTVTYVHIQPPQSYFCIYLESCFWQLDKFKSHIKSLSLFFLKLFYSLHKKLTFCFLCCQTVSNVSA